jgi:hypothetical protein
MASFSKLGQRYWRAVSELTETDSVDPSVSCPYPQSGDVRLGRNFELRDISKLAAIATFATGKIENFAAGSR